MRMFLVGVLAALLSLGSACENAHAAVPRVLGAAFCKQAGTPAHLAELVQESLSRDHSGNTPLDPVACHQKRPATPNDFLAVLPQSDPDSGVKAVSELPAYLRTLVKIEVTAAWYSACLKPGKHGWYPEARCVSRVLHANEVAWGNPRTGKPVLQSDCSNPMQEAARPVSCDHFRFSARAGDTVVRIFEYGPSQIEDRDCPVMVRRVGEREWHSPWFDLCPDSFCSGDAIAAAFKLRSQRHGSMPVEAGTYEAQVPHSVTAPNSPFRIFLCIERWPPGSWQELPEEYSYAEWSTYVAQIDAYRIAHSNSIGIRWFDYLPQREGSKLATVYYDLFDADHNHARTTTGQPSVLWWHWNESWKPE